MRNLLRNVLFILAFASISHFGGQALGISPVIPMSVFIVLALHVRLPKGSLALQIGSLTASGTAIFERDDTPSFLLIADANTALTVSNLQVSISGQPTITITAQNRVRAFAKLVSGLVQSGSGLLAQGLPIATGAIKGQVARISATNSAATTPSVYEFSADGSGMPVIAGETAIQDSASKTFDDFDFLVFDATNLNYASVVFPDGWRDQFSAVELQALFALSGNPAVESTGTIDSQTVVDGSQVASITLFTSGGDITVLRIAIPDEDGQV